MASNPDLYTDIASYYIELVRRDSPEAAAAVEEILSIYGSSAALRTGLVIRIFKIEIQQSRWISDYSAYQYLLEDYPGAFVLLERALGYCLLAWGMRDLVMARQKLTDAAHSDAQTDSAASFNE